MKLIFCVDKKFGIMFLGKRQSKDHILIDKITSFINGSKLWVSNYSSELFENYRNLAVDDNFKEKAAEIDYCFVEDTDYSLENVNEVLLCNWNRQYPADKFFLFDLKSNGFKKISSENIVGSSHDKITIERYAINE